MSRDHRKLEVFHLADGLVLRLYRSTQNFPPEERFGLQTQMRRSAVSVACNIVEGCARRTAREYLHFLNTSFASPAETRYLLHTATRLGMLDDRDGNALCEAYEDLLNKLQKLLQAIERMQQ